jgi:hypothetical protein
MQGWKKEPENYILLMTYNFPVLLDYIIYVVSYVINLCP